MKAGIKSFIRKNWLVLWLVVVSVCLLTTGVVYAAYTKYDSAKIVVARIGGTGKLFSSNYLQRGSMSNVPLYFDDTNTGLIDYVRISNFSQGNPGKQYPRAVNYEISLQLVYVSDGEYVPFTSANASELIGDRYIRVSLNGGSYIYFGKNNGSYDNLTQYTISGCSLAGGSPVTDVLRVEYSADQDETRNTPSGLPRMYLEVVATPTPSSNYLDLEPISGRLELQFTGSVQSVIWNGYINETGAQDSNNSSTSVSSTLDDYNYVIEGVGKGTFTLTWNTSYVELNQDFINEMSSLEGNSYSNGQLVIKVDSDDVSRYDTQFYRTNSDVDTYYSTWGQVKGYISYTFESD